MNVFLYCIFISLLCRKHSRAFCNLKPGEPVWGRWGPDETVVAALPVSLNKQIEWTEGDHSGSGGVKWPKVVLGQIAHREQKEALSCCSLTVSCSLFCASQNRQHRTHQIVQSFYLVSYFWKFQLCKWNARSLIDARNVRDTSTLGSQKNLYLKNILREKESPSSVLFSEGNCASGQLP